MFQKIIKRLFPSMRGNTIMPDYEYFERTRMQQSSPISHSPMASPPKNQHVQQRIQPSQPNDFLDYLFGESSSSTEIDALTQFVADKVEAQLHAPAQLFNELPVMPNSITTLMEQLKNGDFHLQQLLPVIEQEPSMAADVIKLANSARYRRSEKPVTDIKTAFMNMGAQGLQEGVINSYLKNFSPAANIYFRQFGDKIWQHSQETAQRSRSLLEGTRDQEDKATAYFVGLILNLGEMIIFQIMVEAFGHVDPNAAPNSLAFKNLINRYAIRLTYTLAKFWELPEAILHAIAYQAKPGSQGSAIAQAVFDANHISQFITLGKAGLIDAEEVKLRCQSSLKTEAGQKLANELIDELN